MQKDEQLSRQIMMCHLMAIMRIDIESKLVNNTGTWSWLFHVKSLC
ncbi:MAG: hypothetical protein IPK55_08990 [Streptococcus sp.]|nr:hypothetical protein [Streptococcus sp.]